VKVEQMIVGYEVGKSKVAHITWRSPVPAFADLPLEGNSPGDARVVLDEDRPYLWDDDTSSWVSFSAGGMHGDTHAGGGVDPVPLVTVLAAGLMSGHDKVKLNSVEEDAQVNNITDPDAIELTVGGDTALHKHDQRYYTKQQANTAIVGVAYMRSTVLTHAGPNSTTSNSWQTVATKVVTPPDGCVLAGVRVKVELHGGTAIPDQVFADARIVISNGEVTAEGKAVQANGTDFNLVAYLDPQVCGIEKLAGSNIQVALQLKRSGAMGTAYARNWNVKLIYLEPKT